MVWGRWVGAGGGDAAGPSAAAAATEERSADVPLAAIPPRTNMTAFLREAALPSTLAADPAMAAAPAASAEDSEGAVLRFHSARDFGEELELLDDEEEGDKDEDDATELFAEPAPEGLVGGLLRYLGFSSTDRPRAGPMDELDRRRGLGGGDGFAAWAAADGERAAGLAEQVYRRRDACSPFSGSGVQQEEGRAYGVLEKRSPGWVEGWRPHEYLLSGDRLLLFRQGLHQRPQVVLNFGLVRFEVHCRWSERGGGEGAEGEGEDAAAAYYCGSDGGGALGDAGALPVRACDTCLSSPLPGSWSTFFLKPVPFPSKCFAFRGPTDEIKALVRRIVPLVARPRRPGHAEPQPSETDPADDVTERNFWRYPRVREADFVRSAECGDILLFRSKESMCKLTRAVCASSYDHVGLLLWLPKGELLVLEATGGRGVDYVSWADFKRFGWHKCYFRLAYRKVYFQRTQEQIFALQNFICSALGKAYSLNIDKVLFRKVSGEFDKEGNRISPRSASRSSQRSEEEEEEEEVRAGSHSLFPGISVGRDPSSLSVDDEESDEDLEEKTYFCSELVAACLKRCGVLAGDRAACQYWPGSFSQHSRNALPLQERAFIGEEQFITFSDE